MNTTIKPTLLIISILCVCGIANGSIFEIDRIGKTSTYAFVSGSWETGAPCIKTRILTREKVDGKAVEIRAYFYNKDKVQIKKLKSPSTVSKGGKTQTSPRIFEEKEKYDVFFGIPKPIRNGDDEWRYVVVVFGSKGDYVADVYPTGNLEDFEFDEKSVIMENIKP